MESLALGSMVVLGVMAATYVLLRIFRKRPLYSRRPPWWQQVPAALVAGAVVCVALAFAQFRIDRSAAQGTVVLTLDASNSMDRKDVAPNRLDAARAAARSFLAQLPGGYPVAIASFASEASIVQPPTLDRGNVDAALDALPRGKGTVIGDGLTLAINALEEDRELHGERPSAVVLLSDGNDTGSTIAPLSAADRATQLGIPVYTVVLGSVGGQGGANAALLEDMAARTGATTSSAQTADQLNEVYARLGSELTSQLAIGGTGPTFVVIGVLLAIAAGTALFWTSRRQY